jgi:hypothetical protein
VSQRVARGAGVRESFLEQINLFYGALAQSVETGDPAWIEHVMDDWTQSQTETDLLGEAASQTRILSEILTRSVRLEACRLELVHEGDKRFFLVLVKF